MEPKEYNLVFYGKIAKGQDVAAVKQKLAAHFNVRPSTLDGMFTGQPCPIKAKVAYKTALRSQIALEWVGIFCQIEPIPGTQEEDPGEAEPTQVNLIFDGQIAEHTSVPQVKRKLRRLLKLSASRVDELFAGHPVVIMQDVAYQPALRIQTSFELAGALCRLEPVASSSTETPVTPAPNTSVPLRPEETMTCPKCGLVQKTARKCHSCGIYVGIYLKGYTDAKVKHAQQLARQMDAAMQQELRSWGVGLLSLGVVQLAGLGVWYACGIASIGLLNLLVRRRMLFILNSMTACVSGVCTLVLMTLHTLFTNAEIVASAEAGSLELITVVGGIVLLSGVQLYLGKHALKAFKKYAPPPSPELSLPKF